MGPIYSFQHRIEKMSTRTKQLQLPSPKQRSCPTKVTFHKFIPLIITDDEPEQVYQTSEMVEEQKSSEYEPSNERHQQVELEDKADEVIEEIKIKWNSFIKMKKKNYLQDYTVVKEIGKGGFGSVSKVKAKYTGLFRAAKKIKKSHLAKSEHEKLFAEMAIMMALDHPSIARLYQVYDYKNSYVLIVELCEGGQLFKKIVTKSIDEHHAAIYMRQIMQSLVYLHSQGIVHRDLKPENMLFQLGTDNLKLIDFGIAVRVKPEQSLSSRIGTPYYIAPQVLCKKYGPKCDIWSAGVIMYMMIANRPPFNGETETEVMQSILKEQANFKYHCFLQVSKPCIDFLKKILTKNPDLRLSASEAFNHPWIMSAGHQKSNSVSQAEILDPGVNAAQSNKEQIISKITQFKFSNKLEAVVYTFIVSQVLTSEEKKIMMEIFQDLDKNHDGVISTSQLKDALLGYTISEERVNFLMRIIDTNGSGQIDFTEFIVAALDQKDLTENHFTQAFQYFDIDHSGFITYDEIAAFLEDKQESSEQIKKIFLQIDENGDNQISKEEFVKLLMKKTQEAVIKKAEQHRKLKESRQMNKSQISKEKDKDKEKVQPTKKQADQISVLTQSKKLKNSAKKGH